MTKVGLKTLLPDSSGRSAVAFEPSGMRRRSGRLLLLVHCSIGCGNWAGRHCVLFAKRDVREAIALAARFMQQTPYSLFH